MSSTTNAKWAAAFVAALDTLDAAGRARLRRNAGRTLAEARGAEREFLPALPPEVDPSSYESFFLVATLFALAKHYTAEDHTLGTVMRQVRESRTSRGVPTLTFDRRFQALLDSDRAQLPFRLRQMVRLAQADQVPINFVRLLRDVLSWEHPERYVQLRWARDYFVGARQPLPNNSDQTSDDPKTPAESQSTIQE